MSGLRVVALCAEEVRPLRRGVLRPHQRLDEVAFAGDELAGAAHFGARDDAGALLGVASVFPEPHPHAPRAGDWRIRGMATEPAARGRGAGALLLDACLAHAGAHGGRRAWCTARAGVRGFYARAGFAVEGDEFELPDIGPHVLMSLEL